MQTLDDLRRIAIIDDNPNTRASISEMITDAKKLPVDISGPYATVEELLQQLKSQADAAVFDHRLATRNYATFFGAEAVAHLYKAKFPALLVTEWQRVDAEVVIRLYRRNIPVLMPSGEVNPDAILSGLDRCMRELQGQFAATRRPRRTLVRIDDLSTEANKDVADVCIPAWNPHEKVRLPVELITRNPQITVQRGMRLIAFVNTGAETSDELFFENFEVAPEPISEDALT